ncbi:MAG: hypothetical protein COT43_06960 [Candidatus Marinimicrobia bacterium CG08_land_8_20_14_0_20_45_22]|nr:MAG: hypothetical protein COT43_06960 [Candidatus Marinimicrobia bacterium CG08_land_8_20_14_0_20_45_22]
MTNQNFLTRKELMRATGLNPQQVDYLRQRGKLPILNEPERGIPAMFSPECVEIVKAWLKKKSEPSGR